LYVLKEKIQVQPSQDNHEDIMVKNLEKGLTITSSTPQQYTKTHKNKIQEKSKHIKCSRMGHIASHCPTKHKTQETLSKKKRGSSGECATNVERRDIWPILAQMLQRAVALTVTGQIGTLDRSDLCLPWQPSFKAAKQGKPLLPEQG
jgi:hypothetical protein